MDVRTMRLVGLVLFAVCAFACSGECLRYVEEFDLSGMTCGMGKRVMACKSVDGHPLTMSGKVYEHGFGAHPESAVAFTSNGGKLAFDALVGIDADAELLGAGKEGHGGQPSVIFNVWADGRIVWTSDVMRFKWRPKAVHVDLTGAKEIILETRSGRKWASYNCSNGDWADARFTLAEGTELKPIVDPAATAQLGILTPPEKPEPHFNGADIWGVRPGHPVIFRIPVSGVRPMKFRAKNLPEGVTLDPDKGILGGTAPSRTGDYDIEVTAENARGRACRTIRLAVGETLALTPPMGWNSWNLLCYRVTSERVLAAAAAMDASGLGDHGWAYVNIDDYWEKNNSGTGRVRNREREFGKGNTTGPTRTADGRIVPNGSFADMKGMTDRIHAYGFKAGLYSSPGPLTCGKCEGSYGHELQDAAQWAEWGFDFVKYDYCSYKEIFQKEADFVESVKNKVRHPAFERPYRLMAECLRKQDRDILFSFCQYGMGRAEEWAREAGAHCWRSWNDLKDSWTWMEEALEGRFNAEYWRCNGPGCWADPDMMLVGDQYSFGSDHPTYLTPNEQYTHVSLWCMVGAPLILGCDLAKLDAFTKSLLVNDAVIAINQDRLGKTARRIRHVDAESVWVRPLADGGKAVALVNRYPLAREIKVTFAELGFGEEDCFVKDLWRQKCEGRHSEAYAATVPPHATKLVYMKSADCMKCDD